MENSHTIKISVICCWFDVSKCPPIKFFGLFINCMTFEQQNFLISYSECPHWQGLVCRRFRVWFYADAAPIWTVQVAFREYCHREDTCYREFIMCKNFALNNLSLNVSEVIVNAKNLVRENLVAASQLYEIYLYIPRFSPSTKEE